MFEITDSIGIHCAPAQIFAKLLYYFQSTDHYKEWHNDHISCKWIRGSDFSIGSILHATEVLHNSIHKMAFKITKADVDNGIEYKVLFPLSLLRCYGYFNFQKDNDQTILKAGLTFMINPLFKKVFTKQIESISKHMMEEGIAIESSIEKEKSGKI